MAISPRRKLAAGATGLVVLAGAGGAYAATQSNTTARPDPAAEQKAFLNDLAGRLNVTPDALTAAIKGAAGDRIDAAVAAGRLTKEQGDAAKKRLEQANGVPLLGFGRGGPGPGAGGPGVPGGPGGPGFGRGRFGPGPGPGMGMDAAAKYLGLTDKQLFDALKGGKSLAGVAKDKGKSVDGLKAALKDAETAQLDAAVKAGRLTDAERTKILQNLDQRVDDLVSRTPPQGGPRMHGPRRWR